MTILADMSTSAHVLVIVLAAGVIAFIVHLVRSRQLRAKYSEVPMSVADASLVRMAEQLNRSAVLTLDIGFKIYRKHGRRVIPLILPAT